VFLSGRAAANVRPRLITVAEADSQGNLVAAWRSSGDPDLPALLIDRHAHDLVYRRWGLGLRRAEAEVIEDLGDGGLVMQIRYDLELAPTLREGIDRVRCRPRSGM